MLCNAMAGVKVHAHTHTHTHTHTHRHTAGAISAPNELLSRKDVHACFVCLCGFSLHTQVPQAWANVPLLLDYRCYVEGGKLGKRWPPRVGQCLEKLSQLSVQQVQQQYGMPDMTTTLALKNRTQGTCDTHTDTQTDTEHAHNTHTVSSNEAS